MLRAFFVALLLFFAEAAHAQPAQRAEAVFAGGCFWCVESDFEQHLPGVIEAVSGYTGGASANPTYRNYEAGGHIEAVRVVYDPARVSYQQLLDFYWRHIDPTDAGGQFCDRGHAYTTAIFVTPAQRPIAEASKQALVASRRLARVATAIEPLSRFWAAEDYHQDYYRKNSVQYRFYRLRCGRDARIRQVWGEG
ncbi:MAG: peptide-methionine (S)-S-oxide reductase MsrA [Hyphomonadaceae bacterium]|nr:peptide-methionine (S)-S-oxide reductase MsrA [Hyphomonadaceae bacterium]